MEHAMAEIPRKMRGLRKRKAMSQEAFAAATGISRDVVACIETGRRTLTFKNCARIAEAFRDETARDWAYAVARDALSELSNRKGDS